MFALSSKRQLVIMKHICIVNGILYQNASKVNKSDFYSIFWEFLTDLKVLFIQYVCVLWFLNPYCKFELLEAFTYVPFHCVKKNLTNIFFLFATHQIKYFHHIFWIRSFLCRQYWRLCIYFETFVSYSSCLIVNMILLRFLTGCPINLMNYCHYCLLGKSLVHLHLKGMFYLEDKYHSEERTLKMTFFVLEFM